MKLYCHPISTTSRPVMLFVAEQRLPVQLQVVDLFRGEHMQADYAAINPNKLVPTLTDGDFVLTESAAILKYLADAFNLSAYPKAPRERARVNERMDWVNTQLSRDLAYGLAYPQIFDSHRHANGDAQAATLLRGQQNSRRWLQVMNDHLLGAGCNYLAGDTLTIADYHAASFVKLAEVLRSDLSAFPNVQHWLGRMKALPGWPQVYEVIDGFAASFKGLPLAAV